MSYVVSDIVQDPSAVSALGKEQRMVYRVNDTTEVTNWDVTYQRLLLAPWDPEEDDFVRDLNGDPLPATWVNDYCVVPYETEGVAA